VVVDGESAGPVGDVVGYGITVVRGNCGIGGCVGGVCSVWER